MRRSTLALAVAAVIVIPAGCSGNGATPTFSSAAVRSVAVAPLVERDVRGPLVYISDTLGNFIDVFRGDGTLVGRITAGLDYPADLFVDSAHNLWVANDGDNNVLKFSRGAMTADSVYHDVTDSWDPSKCANGKLYVAHGEIAVFARGHHYSTGSHSEKYGIAISVACDAAGNIFATATVASPPGYVVEFQAGSKQAELLPVDLPNPIDAKPDPAGNLMVLDSAGGNYNTVTEYTESGSPTGKSMPTYANWNEIAIAPKGNAIFGADMNDAEGSLRAFPSGKQLRTYVDSELSQLGGIAYDPG